MNALHSQMQEFIMQMLVLLYICEQAFQCAVLQTELIHCSSKWISNLDVTKNVKSLIKNVHIS